MIKFSVDERNRTVIAYFVNSNGAAFRERDLVVDINSRICKIMGKRISGPFMNTPPIALPYGYKVVSDLDGNLRGVAKCNPIDEFDPEIGKNIAAKRLLSKYNKCLLRAIKYVYMDLLRDLTAIRKALCILEYKTAGDVSITSSQKLATRENSNGDKYVPSNIMSLGGVLAKEAIDAANLPDCASPDEIAKSLQKDLDVTLKSY